jgi:hypothetical protein
MVHRRGGLALDSAERIVHAVVDDRRRRAVEGGEVADRVLMVGKRPEDLAGRRLASRVLIVTARAT